MDSRDSCVKANNLWNINKINFSCDHFVKMKCFSFRDPSFLFIFHSEESLIVFRTGKKEYKRVSNDLVQDYHQITLAGFASKCPKHFSQQFMVFIDVED